MSWESLISGLNTACLDAFGEVEAVVYSPAAGGSFPIGGIFDAEYQAIDPDTGAPVGSVRPMIEVRPSDFSAVPVEGDQIVIREVTYRVAVAEPDGQDMTRLLLHRIA